MKIANIFSSLAKGKTAQQVPSVSELKEEMIYVRRKAGLGKIYDNRSALIIQAYEDRTVLSCDDCSFGYSEKIKEYAILFSENDPSQIQKTFDSAKNIFALLDKSHSLYHISVQSRLTGPVRECDQPIYSPCGSSSPSEAVRHLASIEKNLKQMQNPCLSNKPA